MPLKISEHKLTLSSDSGMCFLRIRAIALDKYQFVGDMRAKNTIPAIAASPKYNTNRYVARHICSGAVHVKCIVGMTSNNFCVSFDKRFTTLPKLTLSSAYVAELCSKAFRKIMLPSNARCRLPTLYKTCWQWTFAQAPETRQKYKPNAYHKPAFESVGSVIDTITPLSASGVNIPAAAAYRANVAVHKNLPLFMENKTRAKSWWVNGCAYWLAKLSKVAMSPSKRSLCGRGGMSSFFNPSRKTFETNGVKYENVNSDQSGGVLEKVSPPLVSTITPMTGLRANEGVRSLVAGSIKSVKRTRVYVRPLIRVSFVVGHSLFANQIIERHRMRMNNVSVVPYLFWVFEL